MKQISTLNVAGEVIKAAPTCVVQAWFIGGAVVAQRLHSMPTICRAVPLSPHPYGSMAERPPRCELTVFASFFWL